MQNFSIIGATGSMINGHYWSAGQGVKVSFNNDFKTVLKNVTKEPQYVTLGARTSDSKELGADRGHVTPPSTIILLDSKVTTHEGSAPQLYVLEYNLNRRRHGQQVIKTSHPAEVYLGSDTAHIVLAIRLAPQSQVILESLSAHLTLSESNQGKDTKVRYVARAEAVANAAIEKLATNAKKTINKIVDAVDTATKAGKLSISQDKNIEKAAEVSEHRAKTSLKILASVASSLPETNGSRHFSPVPCTAAIITDEYMFNFYKDAFERVVYLSPENYTAVLAENDVDVIIYVTCWKGLNNEEWKGLKFREAPKNALADILSWAKNNSVPTVFQSIEDPSNFEYFLPIASGFDTIFTSDVNVINDYKIALNNGSVFYGEYGANPLLNNPVGAFRHDFSAAFFAGSYPSRYPERCADMEVIFDSITDSNASLTILDRNYDIEGFDFPDQYAPYILPAIKHDLLQKVHKLYRYSLNFNSIKNSPTMCAMRVYELQAQGKPIISNYARSVFNRFPEIRIIPTLTHTPEMLDEDFPHDEYFRANQSLINIMDDKTSYSVVSSMMEKVGLPSAPTRNSGILVAALDSVELVRELVQRQSVSADVVSLKEVQARPEIAQNYGYFACMRSDTQYEREYLASRVNAFKYTDSDFVSQDCGYEDGTFVPGRFHEFTAVAHDAGKTVVATDFDGLTQIIQDPHSPIVGKGYLADPFGIGYTTFVRSREEAYLAPSPKLTVIIPVHNNGKFLETKCIPSLQRNAVWSQMEILLVDDHSTEAETIRILEQLKHRYPNIRLHRFYDGGSGSAARPRNWGIDHASAPLVAFLDPDNEISTHGYDHLVDEFDRLFEIGTPVDFVSGYQAKIGSSPGFTGKHSSGETVIVKDSVDRFFKAGKFPVVSTQAAVIRREFLESSGLKFVEQSAGQDTLFGWELLARTNCGAFVDTAHLIYYAERDGSVTNTLNPRYFEKSEILEIRQAEVLRELGLYELYKEHQLDNFVRNWYLPRLDRVDVAERGAAREILARITNIYGEPLSKFE